MKGDKKELIKKIIENISNLPIFYISEDTPKGITLNTNLSAENLRKLSMLFISYVESAENPKRNEYVFVSYNTSKNYNKHYFNLERLINDIERFNKSQGNKYDIEGINKKEQLEDEEVIKYILTLMRKGNIIDDRRLEKLIEKVKKNKEAVLRIIKEMPPEILFPELLENLRDKLLEYNKKLIFAYEDLNKENLVYFCKKLEELDVDALKIYALNLDGSYSDREILKSKKWENKLENIIKNSLFQYFNVLGVVLYCLSKMNDLNSDYSVIIPENMSKLDRKVDYQIMKTLKEFGVKKVYIEKDIKYKRPNQDDFYYLELIL